MTILFVSSWRWRLSASHEHKARWRKQFTSLWGRLTIRMSHYMYPAHPISTNALALPITIWNPRKTQQIVTTDQMWPSPPIVLFYVCYIIYYTFPTLSPGSLLVTWRAAIYVFFFFIRSRFPKRWQMCHYFNQFIDKL